MTRLVSCLTKHCFKWYFHDAFARFWHLYSTNQPSRLNQQENQQINLNLFIPFLDQIIASAFVFHHDYYYYHMNRRKWPLLLGERTFSSFCFPLAVVMLQLLRTVIFRCEFITWWHEIWSGHSHLPYHWAETFTTTVVEWSGNNRDMLVTSRSSSWEIVSVIIQNIPKEHMNAQPCPR